MTILFNRSATSTSGPITADGIYLADWRSMRNEPVGRATCYLFGNFGGGTVFLRARAAGNGVGVSILDETLAPISFITEGAFLIDLCGKPEIEFELQGAVAPSLSIVLEDNFHS